MRYRCVCGLRYHKRGDNQARSGRAKAPKLETFGSDLRFGLNCTNRCRRLINYSKSRNPRMMTQYSMWRRVVGFQKLLCLLLPQVETCCGLFSSVLINYWAISSDNGIQCGAVTWTLIQQYAGIYVHVKFCGLQELAYYRTLVKVRPAKHWIDNRVSGMILYFWSAKTEFTTASLLYSIASVGVAHTRWTTCQNDTNL